MKIILPFPPSKLNPNESVHWKAKLATKKDQFNSGYVAAHKFKGKFGNGNIAISLVFVPRNKRRRDLDNLLASCKPMLDGVASGLGVDDRQFRPITIDFGEPDNDNPRTILNATIA